MTEEKSSTGLGRNYPTMVLVVLASIAIMVMYVEAMAFPSLEKVMASYNLHYPADGPLASWIITIYLVVGAIAIPVFGKLGDIYGKKKMLTIAMLIYSVAVTFTGFSRDISSSFYVLLGFRAVQGMGMCMFPLAFSIIRDEFPVERIAVAQGVVSAMFGVGTAVGFVIGGFVIDKLGWQWTYHTVVPFVLIATAFVAFKIKESPVRMKAKVDYVGAAFLGIALLSFLVAVTEGGHRGWTSPIILFLFAASAVSISLFSYVQVTAKYPLIRPSLLRNRDIALINIVAFMIGFGMFGGQSVIALLAEFKFGLSPLNVGFLLLPASLVSLVMGPTVGLLVKKHGPKWPILAGMVIPILGFTYLYYNHASKTDVTIGVTIMSGGLSFAMVGSINMLIISTPQIETAISSAMNMIIRTVGGVVGPAVATVILAANETFYVDPRSGVTVPIAADVAYQTVFLMSAIILAIGAALSLLLTDKRALGEGKGFAIRGQTEPIPAACKSPDVALADCDPPLNGKIVASEKKSRKK